MSYRRADRVGGLLQSELSKIIKESLKDPRIGFVTITRVEVSSDLRYAKIYVTVLGGKEEREQSLIALNHAVGFSRNLLATRVRLRRIPELRFYYDETLDYALSMNKLLDDLGKNGPASPVT